MKNLIYSGVLTELGENTYSLDNCSYLKAKREQLINESTNLYSQLIIKSKPNQLRLLSSIFIKKNREALYSQSLNALFSHWLKTVEEADLYTFECKLKESESLILSEDPQERLKVFDIFYGWIYELVSVAEAIICLRNCLEDKVKSTIKYNAVFDRDVEIPDFDLFEHFRKKLSTDHGRLLKVQSHYYALFYHLSVLCPVCMSINKENSSVSFYTEQPRFVLKSIYISDLSEISVDLLIENLWG